MLETISAFNLDRDELIIFSDPKNMIGTFVGTSCVVDSEISCREVKELFEEGYCERISIVKNNKPLGIIADVSKKAMSRERSKTYDIIIVTKNGSLYGAISINQLLRVLITVQTKMAKEMNPLTYLPGNIVINHVLKDVIKKNKRCAVVYLDLDYFKPYNDLYGFENGDIILKNVADYNSVKKVCQEIIHAFEQNRQTFYTKTDYINGYIISKGRDGVEQRFHLLTLSIAGVYGPMEEFDSVGQLSQYISQVKKEAKEILGHAVVIKQLKEPVSAFLN